MRVGTSILAGVCGLALLAAPGGSDAARVKDFAAVKGVRENQVIGYGLVVGLNGTGDGIQTEFTAQSLARLLQKLGIGVAPNLIRVQNVAAVMVTSQLPPFARTGSKIDALVSSMGDAESLEGGTLLMTPLVGADGEVYGIAQGPISVGGFSAGGGAGSSVQKNHPTVGRIANGATVERELGWGIEGRRDFEMSLSSPDFTTALRTANAINAHFGKPVARARDAGTLALSVPTEFANDIVTFLASVESVEVAPDAIARVVLNERTGTVVMGANVRISKVAVSHGNLSVTISATNSVSQPAPFSDGQTVAVQNQDVTAVEEAAQLVVVDGPVTIGELVQGLNAVGVSPRDLIAILQAIKTAGAMSAELVLM